MRAKRQLTYLEVIRGLRLFVWSAVLGSIAFNLWGGVFITGFALHLGAKNIHIGLLGAIPMLAGIVQPLASYLADRCQSRKLFVAPLVFLYTLLWAGIALLPLIPGGSEQLFWFFFLYTITNIVVMMTNPPYISWLGDMVPEDIRGRYFGRRNLMAGLAGMLFALGMGKFIDIVPKNIGFPFVFGLGVLFAFIEGIIIAIQPEPPKEASEGRSLKKELVEPLKDGNFRLFTIANSLWNFAVLLPGQFFTVFMLRYLHLSYTVIVLVGTVSGIFGLIFQPLFGYLTDKYSNKPILILTSAAACLIPFFHIFMSPQLPLFSLVLLYLINIVGGTVWAGIGLAQFNLLLALSPPEKRISYVGTSSALASLAGAMSPFLGGLVVNALEGMRTNLLGVELTDIKVLFIASTLLRLLALPLLKMIKEERERPAMEVIREVVKGKPLPMLVGIQLLSRGDEEDKIKAIEMLGDARSPLVVERLEELLDDPNPLIRKEAIISLGKIGDQRTVEPLLQRLGREESMDEYIIEALGRLKNPRAVEPLIGFLSSPSKNLRISAIKALGEIGSRNALPYLQDLLLHTEDEETIANLAFSISRLQGKEVLPTLLEAIKKISLPPFRGQVLYAIGKLIGVDIYPYIYLSPLQLSQRLERLFRGIGKDRRERDSIHLALRHFSRGDYQSCRKVLKRILPLQIGEEDKMVLDFLTTIPSPNREEMLLFILLALKLLKQ